MEKLNIVKKISSKYILREIFSFIDYNRQKNWLNIILNFMKDWV